MGLVAFALPPVFGMVGYLLGFDKVGDKLFADIALGDHSRAMNAMILFVIVLTAVVGIGTTLGCAVLGAIARELRFFVLWGTIGGFFGGFLVSILVVIMTRGLHFYE
jgi:hypothetical protein